MRCPQCGAAVAWEVAGGAEVTAGTVGSVVEQRPVLACDRGHRTMPEGLSEALAERLLVALGAARRGPLRRGDRCESCGAALTMPVRRTLRTVTVDDLEAPLVTVTLDVPSTRCPECGLDQVPSRSRDDVVEVAARLLDMTGEAP